jgi:hypothetical protein
VAQISGHGAGGTWGLPSSAVLVEAGINRLERARDVTGAAGHVERANAARAVRCSLRATLARFGS